MKMKSLLVVALIAGTELCRAQDNVSAGVRSSHDQAEHFPGTSTIFDHGVFTSTHASLLGLIEMAYQVNDYQIAGAPGWLNSQMFDILAKAPAERSKLGFTEAMPMLRTLLEDRFKLTIHREKKTVEGYDLVVDKGGLKLQKNNDGQLGRSFGRGMLLGRHISVPEIASRLSKSLDRPVSDSTGIEGFFDVDLRWKPDDLSATPNDDRPTIFAALHEIGLKLQSKKVVAEVIVIDHVERTPSDN